MRPLPPRSFAAATARSAVRATPARLALAALLALSACRAADPAPGGGGQGVDVPGVEAPATDQGPAVVAAQAARWRAAGVARYVFTYERQCFCTPETRGPFVVTVENGDVVDVRRVTEPEGTSVPDTAASNRLRVEDVFALLADAHRTGAAEVRVAYDPALGYPTSVWIDRERQMADEEIGYRLSGLRRL